VLGAGKGEGDCGVEMSPGKVARGVHHDHDNQAKDDRYTRMAHCSGLMIDDNCSRAFEDKSERSDKFGTKLMRSAHPKTQITCTISTWVRMRRLCQRYAKPTARTLSHC